MIGQGTSPALRARARELRKNPTPAEARLWEHLRNHQLSGLHFRRQEVIHGFIVDFVCDAARLVIEIDGSVHEESAEHDSERTKVLNLLGLRVLRFCNDEVLNDIELVLIKINAATEPELVETTPLPVRGGAGGGVWHKC